MGAPVRALPELRFVNRYHDDAGYIAALAQRVQTTWHDPRPRRHAWC
jgi:ferrochelatase